MAQEPIRHFSYQECSFHVCTHILLCIQLKSGLKNHSFFFFAKALLSLNRDKNFALYWCFCLKISFILLLTKWSEIKLERDQNVKPQTLVENFHQAYSNSRKIWNGKLILTAGRWRSKQKNSVQNIYIFKQLEKFVTNLLQIHFVTHFLFYFHFSFSPWRRFVFNQEYWAIM